MREKRRENVLKEPRNIQTASRKGSDSRGIQV